MTGRMLGLLAITAVFATGSEPVATSWILSPAGNAQVAAILPEVHAVEVGDEFVTVRSAGLSLRYLGPLESNPAPENSTRSFAYRFPRHPVPATGRHPRLPAGVAGAFLNGMPIYNQFETLSFNGANIWHYDRIALNARADGSHAPAPGLLEQLAAAGEKHSPLVGFAIDGYPVYGPFGRVNGALRRMRSGYRLRQIAARHERGDGLELTPAQYGPEVSAENPLGTFAEDYEYVAGSGDLDEFNGRFVVTPEYPEGTYAYFLSSNENGQWAFPYLPGLRMYGQLPQPAKTTYTVLGRQRVELSMDAGKISAAKPVRIRLRALDKSGEAIRHFEYVHEKSIHLLVASADLAEFDHIHPELTPDDSYEVPYTFAHGGKYRLWADYSLPGEAPRVDAFDVTVNGPARKQQRLKESSSLVSQAGSLGVELVAEKPLRAGEDIPVTLKLTGSLSELEPYLGAWAHVIVIGEDLQSFSHAHPLEAATAAAGLTHTHAALGPAPSEIHVAVNFSAAGLYGLWAQFQSAGKVLTVPFVLRIKPSAGGTVSQVAIPADAVRVRVTAHGYEPARVAIPVNRAVTLAFSREASPNCGAEVVFPALGIRRAIPLGGTALVELPAQSAGEIGFACGMGMMRGVMIAR